MIFSLYALALFWASIKPDVALISFLHIFVSTRFKILHLIFAQLLLSPCHLFTWMQGEWYFYEKWMMQDTNGKGFPCLWDSSAVFKKTHRAIPAGLHILLWFQCSSFLLLHSVPGFFFLILLTYLSLSSGCNISLDHFISLPDLFFWIHLS